MSQAYRHGGPQPAIAGGVILIASSVLAAVLVAAGLAYAAGTGPRHQAALAAAGCEPGLAPSGLPCTTAPMLARQYLAIMTPARQQLNADAAAYTATDRHHLAAAEAALTAQATTQDTFDASLARLTFPPALAPLAAALIRAGQARAALLTQQARSTTLTQLRSFNDRGRQADATVQTDMKLILNALHPPPQPG